MISSRAFRYALTTATVLATSTPAFAQGAPAAAPGGAPPAGAFTPPAKTAAEKANRQVLLNFGKLLDEGKVDEAFEQYVSRNFHEHDDFASPARKKSKSLRAETIAMFKKDPLLNGADQSKGAVVQKAVADEDMVWTHGSIGDDLYRVVNGKITDHWNFADFSGAPSGG